MSKYAKFIESDNTSHVYTDGNFVIISSKPLPKETKEENDIQYVGLLEDVVEWFNRDKKQLLDSAFNEYVSGLYEGNKK